MTSPTFEAFGFAEPLSRALTQVGYETPTPIQVQAMQPQLDGRDLLGMAETGSGKTATFVLPLLQQIALNKTDPGWKQVSALILAPTRELAVQIDLEVASLARNMNIRRAVVLGGVSKGPQINALKRGVHVCVATPGRLLDHVNMRSCDLSSVQTLIIDEADRMFDMGFIRDINKIVSLIPMKRRTALFSATMPTEIKKFAYDILKDPFRVDLSTKNMVVDRIDQKVMIVRSSEKQSRLHTILADPACERVIVFTRTKRGADRVAERLAMAGINSSAFHGNKAQNARQRALNDFMAGHTRVLVATDIAARGIDVSNITHVINFDMPLDPETYVHRVGRTARKGLNGIAISLCDHSEKAEIKAIERLMKQTIEVIGDVGGEALPMPEKRPHHTHEDPRRVGAHRKGPPRGDRAERGDRNPRDDRAPRGDRSGDRKSGRAEEARTPRAVEAGGFNPAAEFARPELAESPRPERTRSERSHSDTLRSDGSRSDGPRFNKPRDGGSRRRDSEGAKTEGVKTEGRPFEARGSKPAPKPVWKSDGGKPRHSGPRDDAPRGDAPRLHSRPRNDASRHEGPRSDAPRHERPSHERPRFDGPRPERTERPVRAERPERSDRPHSEARAPRPEWKRDGDKPRHEGPRSDKPRHDGPRHDGPRSADGAGKPHAPAHHDKPRSSGPNRSGGKPQAGPGGGERNWNGQKPPKFLKQRDRKPAA